MKKDTGSFDMTKCKVGQLLITKHNKVVRFVEINSNNKGYPAKVQFHDGCGLAKFGTRNLQGHVFNNNREPDDEDIVGFFRPNKNQIWVEVLIEDKNVSSFYLLNKLPKRKSLIIVAIHHGIPKLVFGD